MIEAFFEPVKKTLLKNKIKDSIADSVAINSGKFPAITQKSILIIGLTSQSNLIRQYFYKYSNPFSGTDIFDLGNLKHDGTVTNINAGISEILLTLSEYNASFIILGSSGININEGLVNGLNFKKINHSLVSPFVNLESDSLIHLLNKKKKHFHSGFIASQAFLNNTLDAQLLSETFNTTLSLGQIRSNIENCEPILRQADIFEFDLRSIKHSEFTQSEIKLPNGLTNHEACAICRYAGISNNIMVHYFSNFALETQQESEQMQLAQMIWYTIQGIHSKFNDHPNVQSRNFNVFKCTGENAEEMIFIQSIISDRWWMQVPQLKEKKKVAPQFIGCTLQDYEIAKDGFVPEIWYRCAYSNH